MYRIGDLNVDIPNVWDMQNRLEAYEFDAAKKADIFLDEKLVDLKRWPELDANQNIYLQTGEQFYKKALAFDALMLHASAVKYQDNAYIFSGYSGIGKSTHTNLWTKNISGAEILNDDKPLLRKINDTWMCYGTPWSGKEKINKNDKARVKAIAFITQAEENTFRKLKADEIIQLFLEQTIRDLEAHEMLNLLTLLDDMIKKIPFFSFGLNMEKEACEFTLNHMNEQVR